MKDITRSVLRYTRDILIILIILVFLARTGNMPVLVPDKVTDFIIDMTGDLFNGRVFSSFGGFLSDIGDFFLTGGTDKENRKKLELYKKRIEQYFDRTRRNILLLAAHPDIRRSLPDFRSAFSSMYAKALLENTVNQCFDVNLVAVYTHTGNLVAQATQKGITNTIKQSEAVMLAKIVKKTRGVLVHFTSDSQIVFATSFASRRREKFGVLLMVLNTRGIQEQFSDIAQSKKYLFYCTGAKGKFYTGSALKNTVNMRLKKELHKGVRSISLIREERFLTVGKNTRRSYVLPVRIGTQKTELWLGLLGPEGNILSFFLLMFRLAVLVAIIWLLLYLFRRIFYLARQIIRDRILSRKLLEVSLEKSLHAGSKAEFAAGKAVEAAQMASEAIGRSAGMLKNTPVTKMIEKKPIISPSQQVNTENIEKQKQEKRPQDSMDNTTAPPQKGENNFPDDLLTLDPEGYSPSK